MIQLMVASAGGSEVTTPRLPLPFETHNPFR